jgi:two-component system chemotaxis response regulator CheB
MSGHGDAGLSARLIVGASTGGPRVLTELVGLLPPLKAGMLIVQHMPQYINESLVRSLRREARMEVRLAQEDDQMRDGLILVAPSEAHCVLAGNRRIHLDKGPEVNFVRPSIDVAMQSLGPPEPGSQLVGVLLTGMGSDGAAGLAHVKRLGGLTVVQNEETCALYGMPGAAARLGCVDYQLPPGRIARLLAERLG